VHMHSWRCVAMRYVSDTNYPPQRASLRCNHRTCSVLCNDVTCITTWNAVTLSVLRNAATLSVSVQRGDTQRSSVML